MSPRLPRGPRVEGGSQSVLSSEDDYGQDGEGEERELLRCQACRNPPLSCCVTSGQLPALSGHQVPCL